LVYIFLRKVTKILKEKIKIKPLTKSQIIISLDRLTRFKPTEEKYLRVFKDIVLSCLIKPKYNKKQLDAMPYETLKGLAEQIFNSSVSSHSKNPLTINKKLFDYEENIFSLNENVMTLLENKIDYNCAINMIEGEKLPPNLIWLKSLCKNTNQKKYRAEYAIKFPIEKVVITEGITEEILLPNFAKLCGYDFDKYGVYLISAGGKNQVVKLFYSLCENLKLPVFILLDSDAKSNFTQICPKLRKIDKVYIIPKGEFEDILPISLVKKTLNNYLKNFSSIDLKDLKQNKPMTKILEEIFKQKGFGEFKKAEFAQMVKENISGKIALSKDILNIVEQIKNI